MLSEHFGLAAGATYTIEWDVYPTATNDYLEFINRVRRVEGLNRCVEGAFGLVSGGLEETGNRRAVPSRKEIEAKGVKYVSFFYLNAPADDPGMSLEGFEFPDYPKECALLKKTTAEIHRRHPGVKCMFHIAHGLFITHEPEKRFSDSRVIKENGKQLIYGPDSAAYYTKYISQEKFDQGKPLVDLLSHAGELLRQADARRDRFHAQRNRHRRNVCRRLRQRLRARVHLRHVGRAQCRDRCRHQEGHEEDR